MPFLAVLSLAGLAAPPPPDALLLRDLSESGEALSLEAVASPGAPRGARVRFGAAAAWDELLLEVRGAVPGERLVLVLEGAPEGRPLVPEVSYGEFAWEPVEAGPGTVELVARAPRLLLRLAPSTSGGSTPDAPYYSYARFQGYLEGVLQDPRVQGAVVGRTVQGRPLVRLVIDEPSPLAKKTVVMVVRQHGDEDGSSYVLEGALDLLLGRGGQTPEPELLQLVRWVIYPLANPDGAVANARTNSNGFDLNREWDRNGCSSSQQPETEALQCDLEAVQEQHGIAIVGDHHGWGNGVHGGYRYALGQSVSNVNASQYQEAKKDTTVITRHDPTQVGWEENGGVLGMLRAEMFLRFGFLVHTPEYDDLLSTEAEFQEKGRAWVRAMVDTLFAPRFADALGETVQAALLPAEPLFLWVDDDDENLDPQVRETVQALVADPASGDAETLTLTETGTDTGVFVAPVAPVPAGPGPLPGDGRLEVARRARLTALYVDDDRPEDASETSVLVVLDPARTGGVRRP